MKLIELRNTVNYGTSHIQLASLGSMILSGWSLAKIAPRIQQYEIDLAKVSLQVGGTASLNLSKLGEGQWKQTILQKTAHIAAAIFTFSLTVYLTLVLLKLILNYHDTDGYVPLLRKSLNCFS